MGEYDAMIKSRPFFARYYDSVFSAFELQNVLSSNGVTTTQEEVEYLTDIPCRINQKGFAPAEVDEKAGVAPLKGQIKIYCDPELVVIEGSRIVCNGVDYYVSSAKPLMHHSHQEILVNTEKDFA
jgi:hypothetical protein